MLGAIETRSAPTLLGATHRAFTFYLGNPISSIETRSAPGLTHVLPPIRPVGFPIYVAPPGGLDSLAAARCGFTFYLADPLGSIDHNRLGGSGEPLQLQKGGRFCFR